MAELFDVELLVAHFVGVGEVLSVGEVGFLVVLGGFVEEAVGEGAFELVDADAALLPLFELPVGEVFGYGADGGGVGLQFALEVGEVDPGGDGGFEEGDVFAVFVGVVAEVGVAGFDEDDGFEAYFAEDGGEEDAGVDAVGLAVAVDFVEEAYVLDVGVGGGVGGAGDGGVGDAALEGVAPDGADLFGDVAGSVLVAGEADGGVAVEDVGEDLLDVGVVFVDVGGEEVAGVDEGVGGAEGEWAFADGARVEAEVFDVDGFVVDVAGEGEVEGARLAEGDEGVVFPFDVGGEGVVLSAVGEDFLEDGDVVEGGGVDDDAQHGVVARGGEGDLERGEGCLVA